MEKESTILPIICIVSFLSVIGIAIYSTGRTMEFIAFLLEFGWWKTGLSFIFLIILILMSIYLMVKD